MGALVRHFRVGESVDLFLDGEKVGEIVLESNRRVLFRDLAPRLRVQHRRKLAVPEAASPQAEAREDAAQ